MNLYKIFLAVLFFGISGSLFAQAKGNYDYRASSNINYAHPAVQAAGNRLTQLQAPGTVELRIKGLSNCKADSYLAIFTVTQVGKTQSETDELLLNKIEAIREGLGQRSLVAEMFIDMISFLPVYEMEESKKLFSKSTYNEIPVGFELKKNLHFQYRDPKVLEELVTLCAGQEIYDLVRVDYFIDDIAKKKDEMIAQAEVLLGKKLERYKKRLADDFENMYHQYDEGFAIYYPIEQYRSYQTYHSNTLSKTTSGETRSTQQTTAQFFQPRMSKDYDFVINNEMLEPVVQIEFELVFRLTPKPEPKEEVVEKPAEIKTVREYYLITPQAEVRKLGL